MAYDFALDFDLDLPATEADLWAEWHRRARFEIEKACCLWDLDSDVVAFEGRDLALRAIAA